MYLVVFISFLFQYEREVLYQMIQNLGFSRNFHHRTSNEMVTEPLRSLAFRWLYLMKKTNHQELFINQLATLCSNLLFRYVFN